MCIRDSNIGIYEYAKVYQLIHPNLDYPSMSSMDWLAFEQIVNYTQQKLEHYIGLTDLNEWGVLTVLFFSHSELMKEKLPEHYEQVKGILGILIGSGSSDSKSLSH